MISLHPNIETQSVYFQWSAGGIPPVDDSFYTIHPWTWTSAPTVNTYGTPIPARSRLKGRIRHVCIANINTGATISTEPVSLEIHIHPGKKTNTSLAPVNPVIIKKLGVFNMNNSTSTPNCQTQPSHFACDIPVEIGTTFFLVFRTPTMANNPTGFLISGVAVIEGISDEDPTKIFGLKNIDVSFGVTGNLNPVDDTRYYWPFPQLGASMITSNYTYHASPIDGFIVGATYAQLTSGASSSGEDMTLGVEKKYGDSKCDGIITRRHKTFFQVGTNSVNTFVKYYGCKIPIRKGELYTPFMITPAYATNPVGLRPYIVLHLQGN